MTNNSIIKRIAIGGADAKFIGKHDSKLYWSSYGGYFGKPFTDKTHQFTLVITDENLVKQEQFSLEFTHHQESDLEIDRLIVCENDDLLICGRVRHQVNDDAVMLVFRTDANGNMLWSNTYYFNSFNQHSISNGPAEVLELSSNKYVINTGKLLFTIDATGRLEDKMNLSTGAEAPYQFKVGQIANSGNLFLWHYSNQESSLFSILDPQLETIQTVKLAGELPIKHVQMTADGSVFYCLATTEGEAGIKYLFAIDTNHSIPQSVQARKFVLPQVAPSAYHTLHVVDEQVMLLSFFNVQGTHTMVTSFGPKLVTTRNKSVNGGLDFIRSVGTDKMLFSDLTQNQQAITNLTLDDCLHFDDLPALDLHFEALQVVPFQQGVEQQTVISYGAIALNAKPSPDVSVVTLCPTVVNLNDSAITASQYVLGSNGVDTSEITVKLIDADGHFITWGDFDVQMQATAGTLTAVSRASDGAYKANLTFASGDVSSTVSFSVDGSPSPNTVQISYLDDLALSANLHQQSPHLFIQAAGSTGSDGAAPGIHLRWAFKHKLGNEHLPKGNLATGTANFNKANDFVTLYRAPYQKAQVTLDLSEHPLLFDHANYTWLYKLNGHKYLVQFKDKLRYTVTLQGQANEVSDTLAFLAAYGDAVVEIESRDQVAFSAEVQVVGQQANSQLKTELLAVDNDLPGAAKHLIARKTFSHGQFTETYQAGDNLRSIRLSAFNCQVQAIAFELYSDFLTTTHHAGAWEPLGNFALTTNDNEAFQRLEPTAGTVGGKWPRFQTDCPVDLENYQQKWSGPTDADDRNFKAVVQQYITLSNDTNNPRANETITYVDDTADEPLTDSVDVSNLDVLNYAALDYHVARMLGLGHLDLQLPNDTQQYIYLAEYTTNQALGNVNGVSLPSGEELDNLNPSGEVQHLYMTLPTGKTDERLPLPVDLKAPYPGIWKEEEAGNSITDDQGYILSGQQRYISLLAEDLKDFSQEQFFASSTDFNASENTTPVNAGLSYRLEGQDWKKPELSSESVALPSGRIIVETIPINLPEPNEILYVHRETQAGKHYYRAYGINWFGRATSSAIEQAIETDFPIVNRLLPPTALNATHIIEEDPLILTSANEQERLEKQTNADQTLVRLVYEYDQKQDLVSHKVTTQDELNYPDLTDTDAMVADADEVFAQEFELFFRNRTPQNLRGKITRIYDDPSNQAVSIIETGIYRMSSTGEEIVPQLPVDTPASNFTGGILVIGDQRYVIQELSETQPFPRIKVFKQAISQAFQNDGSTNLDNLETPTTTGEEIFMALENMNAEASWGNGNPSGFKITMPFNEIHREVIVQEGLNATLEKTLEKFRGVLDHHATVTEEEQAQAIDETGNVTATVHKGLYKITLQQKLAQHPQYNEFTQSVEWAGGVVRIHTESDPEGARKVLKVVKAEGFGPNETLTLYAIDDAFTEVVDDQTGTSTYVSQNPILTGTNVSVNYYPGYKIYLEADEAWGITEANLRPAAGEKLRYSLFGARSIDPTHNDAGTEYRSAISTPAMMFSQRIIPALKPEQPEAIPFATRPDSFGKSTFTFSTRYSHEPFAVQFGRIDDQGILNALYQPATIKQIRTALSEQRRDLYATNRWQNLLSFDYADNDGEFGTYPDTVAGFKFPNPDKTGLFETGETPGSLKPGAIAQRMKAAVLASFVPLTEIPLIYAHIHDADHRPVNKKQVIRDRNGRLLNPDDARYDISPMAKKLEPQQVQFTDFTLDGTSTAQYFYVSREFSNTMQMGEHSAVFGPVQLINTQAPLAPQISRVRPQLPGSKFGMQKVALTFEEIENLEIQSTQISGIEAKEGSAVGLQIMKGNISVSFSFEENSLGAVALSPFYKNGAIENMKYAVKAATGNQLLFSQAGAETSIGSYVTTDKLMLQKIGSQVMVLKNGKVIHRLPHQLSEDLLLSINLQGGSSKILGLQLETDGNYYRREVLVADPVQLTMINLDNAEIGASGEFTKKSNTNAWDAGAISLEFMPFYGAINFKVKANSSVAVGLSAFNEDRTLASIDYALRTDENGYLYVTQNGHDLLKSVAYNEANVLTLERRNTLLSFKKDGRTFYEVSLTENQPYLIDFSLYSAASELRELTLQETKRVSEERLSIEKQAPAIRLEMNRYPANQKLAKISLYRTLDPAKISDVRMMDLVEVVDLVTSGLVQENTWFIEDRFRDLEEVPYGDPIYYRLIASREVNYMNGEGKLVTEYAPSAPSRLLISAVVEATNPNAPEVFYSIDESILGSPGEQISLHWNKTVYHGRYSVYQMNRQGQWNKIHELQSKAATVQLKLSDTDLTLEQLEAINANPESIYHHFRVDVENAAGLSNLDQNQLTIPSHQFVAID